MQSSDIHGSTLSYLGILGGPRSLVGGHRQLRFATSSAGAASVKSRLSHVTRSSQGTSDKLSIEGLGFKEEDRIEGKIR